MVTQRTHSLCQHFTCAVCGALAFFVCETAHADGPLGANDEPITTSDYAVDMYQGPFLGTSRATGLAGSIAAIAEGADGMVDNAASPAVRFPFSTSYFDYDFSFGITSATFLEGNDFDNNGRVRFDDGSVGDTSYERFFFLTLGGTIQLGAWGLGLSLDAQNYLLGETPTIPDAPPNLRVSLYRPHLLLARAFLDQRLIVGVGLRGVTLAIDATENVNGTGRSVKLVSVTGGGAEIGAIYMSRPLPLRLGLTLRSPVQGTVDKARGAQITPEGDTLVGARYLPTRVTLPWDIEAGIAYQIGPRPLNVYWIDPSLEVEKYRAKLRAKLPDPGDPTYEARLAQVEEQVDAMERRVVQRLKRRYAKLSRQKLLVTASISVSGPVGHGVGVESFLQQRVERSGKWVTFQPRLGVELEPIDHHLQLRAGSYVEPSRFSQKIVRVHGTAGFDLRLFQWSVFGFFDDDTSWRVGAGIDGAQRYLSLGMTAGIWH